MSRYQQTKKEVINIINYEKKVIYLKTEKQID